MTRQAEALFGAYIPQREYVVAAQAGAASRSCPTPEGNNCILVDVREHPHPMGERLRRQITEGAIIQAAGRARAGLRGEGEPLDIHLWTDVPVPELGPVEPVLWSELEAGLGRADAGGGGLLAEEYCRRRPGLRRAVFRRRAQKGAADAGEESSLCI